MQSEELILQLKDEKIFTVELCNETLRYNSKDVFFIMQV